MKKLTAILHRGAPDEGGFWATCLEVPGANGQGVTKEECLADLKNAVNCCLKPSAKKRFASIPARKQRNWNWHETPGFARYLQEHGCVPHREGGSHSI